MIRNKFLLPTNLQPSSAAEGFQRLCELPNTAFLQVSPVSVTEKCKIVAISNSIFQVPIGIILRNHFPFSASMNHQ